MPDKPTASVVKVKEHGRVSARYRTFLGLCDSDVGLNATF
jgi:hypothetical protein